MKIAISGPGRCGKDTAAEHLATITPLRYVAGTSYWARRLVYEEMKWLGHDYADANACWLDRHRHRMLWAAIIGEYNAADPVKLYRDCLADQDILTGIRHDNERQAIKAAGLVSLWIWIERPGCVDPTMQYTAADCDLVVANDGTLAEFHERLRDVACEIGLAPYMRALVE